MHDRSAIPPVGGVSVQVHHRHDENLVSPNPEEDTEGECPREAPLDIQSDGAVQSRVQDNTVNGILY